MDSMTSKERWLAVLNREIPDRIPMDYGAANEVTAKLKKHFGCATDADLFARLHIDRPMTVKPEYVGPPIAPGTDMYGCRFKDMAYGAGIYEECVSHPLADFDTVEEIEAQYTWPTADWFDYSTLPAQARGHEDLPIRAGRSQPFQTYVNLRGIEKAYIDLAGNREYAEYCLDKLFDFAYENTRRIFETIPDVVTISYVAEDFGSQENLLFSPRIIRNIFVPRMKRMIDLVHEGGAYAFFHSDGAIREIIPNMIAAGIDALGPLQWRAKGMDRAGLKADFGDQVILRGGVDNQQTIPFGSADDVRQEVLDNLRILGAGGGYILAPCHNMQPVTPIENVIALYETGYEYGRS